MKLRIILLFSALTIFGAACAQPPPPVAASVMVPSAQHSLPTASTPPSTPPPMAEGAVAYRIEIGPKGELVVHLAFRGDAAGETALDLPTHWAGEDRLYEGITSLAIEGDDASVALVHTDKPERPVVHHPPGAEVHVRYAIARAEDETAEISQHRYRPIVRRDYFHLIGEVFIVHPAWDPSTKRSIDGFTQIPEIRSTVK